MPFYQYTFAEELLKDNEPLELNKLSLVGDELSRPNKGSYTKLTITEEELATDAAYSWNDKKVLTGLTKGLNETPFKVIIIRNVTLGNEACLALGAGIAGAPDPGVSTLILENCVFADKDAVASFAQLLPTYKSLEALSLAGSLKTSAAELSSSEICDLLKAVDSCPNIMKLNVQDIKWDKNAGEAFSFMDRIEELCLCGGDLSNDSSKVLIRRIALPLRKCFLRKLDMRGMGIGHEEGTLIAKALKTNEWLNVLLLDNNQITDSVGVDILSSIQNNAYIRIVCLGLMKNLLGDQTATFLPKVYENKQIIIGDPKDPNAERVTRASCIQNLSVSLERASLDGWHDLLVFWDRYLRQVNPGTKTLLGVKKDVTPLLVRKNLKDVLDGRWTFETEFY